MLLWILESQNTMPWNMGLKHTRIQVPTDEGSTVTSTAHIGIFFEIYHQTFPIFDLKTWYNPNDIWWLATRLGCFIVCTPQHCFVRSQQKLLISVRAMLGHLPSSLSRSSHIVWTCLNQSLGGDPCNPFTHLEFQLFTSQVLYESGTRKGNMINAHEH